MEQSTSGKTHMEVDDDNLIADCDFNKKEMLMVNLKTLEQICLQLASYLENNEIANVEDLARVQQTMAEVFPNSLTKAFMVEKAAGEMNDVRSDGKEDFDMFDNQGAEQEFCEIEGANPN